MKIGDLRIPRVATGFVGDVQPGKAAGKFEIAKNEAGEIFTRAANTLGERWLAEKGFRAFGVFTKEAGAAAVWGQIDALSVNSLNGGKGIEGP